KLLFRQNGISHLLAVSGFHVGLIYSILLSLFFFISASSTAGKLIRLFAIVLLWFYAYITGGTPSVLRATFMISLFVAGSLTGHKSHPFNTLCIAAFTLLIINPFTLFDIGFQLSFLAVAGILISQVLLRDRMNFQNQWLRKFTGFVCVCMAAQISTLPLTLYSFGAFSPYFLIGNIIAIPLIYIIIFLSLPALSLFLISGISLNPIIRTIEILFDLLARLLSQISALPYAYPDTIKITFEHVWLLYAVCFCFVLWALLKSKIAAIGAILFGVLLFLPFRKWEQDHRKQIIILNNTPGNSLFAHSNNYYAHISTIPREYETGMAEKYFGISNVKQHQFGASISIENKKILFLDTDSLRYATSKTPLPIDFLVLKRGCKGDLTKINQLFSPQQLILDGSLSDYWLKKWRQEAEELGIPCFNMKENGAFSYFFH
ncbi:MAG: ComEC/Rec2 family competence protein, partial [Bacteroidales bacterium]